MSDKKSSDLEASIEARGQQMPVFLSYRSTDVPGYVGRLSDDIRAAYGDVVFRDVDSIRAGEFWDKEIKYQLCRSRIVVAIIGDEWESSLSQRFGSDQYDYVRYELNTARELEIPIIPVLLNHTSKPRLQELGDLSWLLGRQFFQLSDFQGRWKTDSLRLMDQIGTTGRLIKLEDNIIHSSSSAKANGKLAILSILVALFIVLASLLRVSKTVTSTNGVVAGDDINARDIWVRQ